MVDKVLQVLIVIHDGANLIKIELLLLRDFLDRKPRLFSFHFLGLLYIFETYWVLFLFYESLISQDYFSHLLVGIYGFIILWVILATFEFGLLIARFFAFRWHDVAATVWAWGYEIAVIFVVIIKLSKVLIIIF